MCQLFYKVKEHPFSVSTILASYSVNPPKDRVTSSLGPTTLTIVG